MSLAEYRGLVVARVAGMAQCKYLASGGGKCHLMYFGTLLRTRCTWSSIPSVGSRSRSEGLNMAGLENIAHGTLLCARTNRIRIR